MSYFAKRSFEGKTIEEAIERAEKELGISKDKFIYDIVRKSSGFMGLGQRIIIEVSPRPVDVEEEEEKKETQQEVLDAPSNGDVTGRLKEFFEGLLTRLNESGRIEISEDDRKIIVKAALEEGSIFLNRRGHTIDSIKYLLNLVAIREGSGHKRISIFIAEKPSDDNIDLVEMAREIKDKVERSHRTISIGGMDSRSRKVFHSVIGRGRGVVTYSEGNGMQRKLYVSRSGRTHNNYKKQHTKKNYRGGKRDG